MSDGWEPGRWHRVRKPDGSLWMETSDRDEAQAEAEKTGWPLERLYVNTRTEWRYEHAEPTITLIRALQTCWACPAQWDAWDADGQTYYLRFRSGVGTVEAVSTPTTTAESLDSAELVAKFRYGDNLLGSIELDLFCELAGIRLAENAEVS